MQGHEQKGELAQLGETTATTQPQLRRGRRMNSSSGKTANA
jgi:hypothetical protein